MARQPALRQSTTKRKAAPSDTPPAVRRHVVADVAGSRAVPATKPATLEKVHWDFAAVQLQHIKHGWDKDVLSLLCDLGMSKLASTTWADVACVVNQKLAATRRHPAEKATKDNVLRIYQNLRQKIDRLLARVAHCPTSST
ncbi:hypothetical protein SDRG_11215 [Saprolegnia diclina VS20]|uniref:Uncharacterized protein n=1 Tax=Saprolegnia diclina (strain VS20) TaxID=1156394 RepID=T0RFG5_SAPDV|nr:hypothetical protein SDRG_11215 [Saprolegnia diclina VS20]EQC31028.1 hypothetical protein SDRG_11215 [Saprolegnia diclina VS20]|eukprot:XP_008615467.1 hypothetical protein SDRG_11215 [Saprolegnia diclina VS20]